MQKKSKCCNAEIKGNGWGPNYCTKCLNFCAPTTDEGKQSPPESWEEELKKARDLL